MTTPAEDTNSLHDALKAAVDPVREQLARIDAEIARREAELTGLRTLRTEARRILRVLEPSENGQRSKAKRSRPTPSVVGVQTLERVEQFIRDHFAADDTVSAPKLIAHPRWKSEIGKSSASASLALNALTERGVLRLDRVGETRRTRRGMQTFATKFYKRTG